MLQSANGGDGTVKAASWRKILLIVGGGAAVLLVIIVAGLLLSGYMAITWKQPAQETVLSTRVCGDDVVASYNEASLAKKRGNSNEYTTDEAALSALATTIKKKAGYQNDPTCQMIMLMRAVQKEDYATAKTTYEAELNLHGKHLYADSNLRTGGSLSDYDALVKALSPSSKQGDTQGAKGGA